MEVAAWDLLPPSVATLAAPSLVLPPLVRFGLIIAAIVFAIFGVAIALMNARPKAAPVPKPMSLRVTSGSDSARVSVTRPPSATRVERAEPAPVSTTLDESELDPYQLAQARARLRDVRATLEPHPPAQPPYTHPDDADNPFLERPNGLSAPSASRPSTNGTAVASPAPMHPEEVDEEYDEPPLDDDEEAFSIAQPPARGSMLSGFFSMVLDAFKSWSVKRRGSHETDSYEDETDESIGDVDEDDEAPVAAQVPAAPAPVSAPQNGLRPPTKIGQAEVITADASPVISAPEAKVPKTPEELALEEAAWELALARSSKLEREAISIEIEDDTGGAVLPDYLLENSVPDGVAVAIGTPEKAIVTHHDESTDLSYVMDTIAEPSVESVTFVDVLFEDDPAPTLIHSVAEPAFTTADPSTKAFDAHHRDTGSNGLPGSMWETDDSEPTIAISLVPDAITMPVTSSHIDAVEKNPMVAAPSAIPAAIEPIVPAGAGVSESGSPPPFTRAPADGLDIAALLAQVESDSKSGKLDEEHARRERERLEEEERERKTEMLRSVTWTRLYLGDESPSLDIYERIRFIKVLGDMDDFDAVMPVLYKACNEEPHPDVLFEAYRVLTDCYNGDFLMAAHQLYLEHDDERMRDVAARGIADLKRVPS